MHCRIHAPVLCPPSVLPLSDETPGQPQTANCGEPAATLAARHPRLIKVLQYLGAAIVFGTLAFVAARFGYKLWQQAQITRARHANCQAFVDVLQAAGTPEQLEEATDPDGVVLRIKDGSWIAIRYVESDHLPRAVARDSGGSWFETDRQFHYALGHYRLWQEIRARAKATSDPVWSEEGFLSRGLNRQLDAVEQSADLRQARQRLRELGFEEFKP